MVSAEAESKATSTESRPELPWGIRFHYRSAGRASSTLPVVRAAVAAHVPGWEIRQAIGQDAEDGWFEALPPLLPDYLADDPSYRKEFQQRLEVARKAIAEGVHGVSDAEEAKGVPESLIQVFLEGVGEVCANETIASDFAAQVESDQSLQASLLRWRPESTRLSLLHRVRQKLSCQSTADEPERASPLCAHLSRLECKEQERLTADRRVGSTDLSRFRSAPGIEPPAPTWRQLRAYSFDPSLATTLDTAPIHQVTIPTRWEPLAPGPIGEYLEVVDVDHASGCAYLPVDLEHTHIVAQDGLPPSEGNPQFHQQMVYAVAMNTIHRFEQALGRPVFWSPLRPWFDPEEAALFPPQSDAQCAPSSIATANGHDAEFHCGEMEAHRTSRFIQRLRVYPHALREANAYYSPSKRALLFGYFPNEGENNGMVFTCLSHDIIVHETTHAIVDGMHSYFNEPSNEDVWAFHEAFADIMALFQHFTYPEVLRHQIAATRGNLETDNLLGQLAQQFGQATGRRGGLRNYLGTVNDKGQWERTKADPQALRGAREPHERGSILVAAVFDAFLALYNTRVRDLLRISTGGSGVLPEGRIHPDLANRLAKEAAQTAEEVMSICIRAMDYLPPVDITFGEFLRALITADYERSPTAGHENRIAFIDAFRSWGIYPRDVTTLSEESLRWNGPEPGFFLEQCLEQGSQEDDSFMAQLTDTLEAWRPGGELRQCLFTQVVAAQAGFYCFLKGLAKAAEGKNVALLPGIDLAKPFNVDNMRPTRSIGPQGEVRVAMIVEIVQELEPVPDAQRVEPPIRGGVTLIIDLQTWEIRYTIYKRLYEHPPSAGVLSIRGQHRLRTAAKAPSRVETTTNLAQRLAATYSPQEDQTRRGQREPFAMLHRSI